MVGVRIPVFSSGSGGDGGPHHDGGRCAVLESGWSDSASTLATRVVSVFSG